MEDYADRYGTYFVKLTYRYATRKEFEFDQKLLMPTADGYRALIDLAEMEVRPRIKIYLQQRWSRGALENFLYLVMAAAVYARSVSSPPYKIDIERVLLRTAAFCNRRCAHKQEMGGGCRASAGKAQHHLPKCIKVPKDIEIIWKCLKKYIATGKAEGAQEAIDMHSSMGVQVDLGHDFSPATSC